MRKLRIGQISPINLPVPPKKYGGTEKIIYSLCEGLKKRGHNVFLFGSKDSKVSCNLEPVIKKSLWLMKAKDASPYYAYYMTYLAKRAKELNLDILHDHLGPWALTLYSQLNIPIIHTLHVPFRGKGRIWAYKKLNAKLVSISLTQRKPAPDLNYAANIYNGIDIKDYIFNAKPKDYYLWIGELSPRKGILEVIEIAKMAKIKLVLAGRIPPPQQAKDYKFFKKHIEKQLNKRNITYLGEETEKELIKLYKNASAFLFPLQWEEPFGLIMIEAMACGTPVIAFRRGAVPEIIKHKETGFVIKPWTKNKEVNYKDFIAAIKNIDGISREKCRKSVEENFTQEKMVSEYEKLYYEILENQNYEISSNPRHLPKN